MKQKLVRQLRQVIQTIKVIDGRYCDPKCVGFSQRGYGGYGCGVFQAKLKEPDVMPDNQHYESFVRCAKCRKAEIT